MYVVTFACPTTSASPVGVGWLVSCSPSMATSRLNRFHERMKLFTFWKPPATWIVPIGSSMIVVGIAAGSVGCPAIENGGDKIRTLYRFACSWANRLAAVQIRYGCFHSTIIVFVRAVSDWLVRSIAG